MEWPHGVFSVFTSNIPKFDLCISEASTLYLIITAETIYIGEIIPRAFLCTEASVIPEGVRLILS